jgi:hypothetical protein
MSAVKSMVFVAAGGSSCAAAGSQQTRQAIRQAEAQRTGPFMQEILQAGFASGNARGVRMRWDQSI